MERSYAFACMIASTWRTRIRASWEFSVYLGNSPKLDDAIKFRRKLIARARGIAWAFLSIKLILKAVAERFNMLSDGDNMLILLTKTANVVDDIQNILLYKRNKRIWTKLNNTLWFHRHFEICLLTILENFLIIYKVLIVMTF